MAGPEPSPRISKTRSHGRILIFEIPASCLIESQQSAIKNHTYGKLPDLFVRPKNSFNLLEKTI